MRALN